MDRRTFLKVSAGSAAALGVAAGGYRVGPLIVGAAIGSPTPPAQPNTPLAALPTAPSITLGQAWDVALQAGKKWDADAMPASLSSYDMKAVVPSSGDEQSQAGTDGTRRAWRAMLVADKKRDKVLLVDILDGAAVQTHEQPIGGNLVGLVKKPAFDSPAAIQAARAAKPAMTPATGQAHGYLFTLDTGKDSKPVLGVIGNYHGQGVRVEFDPSSGTQVAALVHKYTQGGILSSSDKGQTWQASDLTGVLVTGIGAIPEQNGSAYAVEPGLDAVRIHRTTDGGRTWKALSPLPADAGFWAYEITAATVQGTGRAVAVGTSDGLWVSTNDGGSWRRTDGIPSGPVQFLVSTSAQPSAEIVASIGFGSNAGLYRSTDLKVWQKLRDGGHRLSLTDGGQHVLAIPRDGATTAFLIDGAKTTPVNLSLRAQRTVGAVETKGVVIAQGNEGVAISTDGGVTWTTTLKENVTGFAVSADARTAVAGGFRTGIFRSSDGGQTWANVLSDPTKSGCSGSNEITSMTFLSQDQVVAVNGGLATWEAF